MSAEIEQKVKDIIIEQLHKQGFKVDFETIYVTFTRSHDLVLLKLLLDKFINKDSVVERESFYGILEYLCINSGFELMESLFKLRPLWTLRRRVPGHGDGVQQLPWRSTADSAGHRISRSGGFWERFPQHSLPF